MGKNTKHVPETQSRPIVNRTVKSTFAGNSSADVDNRLEPTSAGVSEEMWAIVDSRSYVREAFAIVLQQSVGKLHNKNIEGFSNVASLVQTIGPNAPDKLIVLIGESADGQLAQEEVELLRAHFTDPMIVVMVNSIDQHILDLWERLRPAAIIPGDYTSEQVAACLGLISVGAQFLPVTCVNSLLESIDTHRGALDKTVADQEHLARIASMLTPRQREVMRYVAMGRSNKYIASELDVCESTIKVHVSELLRRLGATSRTHAAWLFNHLPADAGREKLY